MKQIPSVIARMLPRLASDQPGEVVATAAAIGRTLAAGGLDFHDLAAALDGAAIEKTACASAADVPTAPKFSGLTHFERIAWAQALTGVPEFSAWESQRAADISNRIRFSPHVRLSPKEVRAFDELLARAYALGVRP